MSLSQETVTAITDAVVAAFRNSLITTIQPRRMNERDAAIYVGRSFYWLRNLRKADDERVQNGGERRGPQYYRESKTPFYFREDLDAWLKAFKERAAK